MGYVTPRLSDVAASVAEDYDEAGEYVKLYRPEGEIDFICSGWLTPNPYRPEQVLRRTVNVETPAEIIAKKVHHRAATFKARDLFDLATVFERDPHELGPIVPVVQGRRQELEERIESRRASLQDEFDALDLFDTTRSLDDCIEALQRLLRA